MKDWHMVRTETRPTGGTFRLHTVIDGRDVYTAPLPPEAADDEARMAAALDEAINAAREEWKREEEAQRARIEAAKAEYDRANSVTVEP